MPFNLISKLCLWYKSNFSLFILLSLFCFREMDKKINIVGAGAAGIAAATKLTGNGFENVTILEAENRISFGANIVDMGAQWLAH